MMLLTRSSLGLLKRIGLCACLSLCAGQTFADSLPQTTQITVLPNHLTLDYPSEVRFSQVLFDGHQQSSYDIYRLGIALIDPSQSAAVDVLKKDTLQKLQQINTSASLSLARQLAHSSYVSFQSLETDPTKVRVNPKFDPLMQGQYWLLLPERPDHVTVFAPGLEQPLLLNLILGGDLRDYLTTFSESKLTAHLTHKKTDDKAWVIQADRTVYPLNGIQWKGQRHFLSPGATVFLGLEDLPDAYRDINAQIARLLAFRLEL